MAHATYMTAKSVFGCCSSAHQVLTFLRLISIKQRLTPSAVVSSVCHGKGTCTSSSKRATLPKKDFRFTAALPLQAMHSSSVLGNQLQ
jgi:hypothetical protein